MTDRELLEKILEKIGDMDSRINNIDSRVTSIDSRVTNIDSRVTSVEANMATKQELAEVKADVRSIKETVIKIENDHGQKLKALFDGYKLNSEKLERIESEVTKHEEIILRRIR
ncbi:MAG: hypothetical protein ACOX1X_03550 [Dethiobacteria bacterium]|jgi:chromosome segregation ATPase